MCRPNLLIPKLPAFLDKKWTRMDVIRKPDGFLVFEISFGPLPSAHIKWYSKTVDVLSLEKVKQHWSSVHEVLYLSLPAICKIACFDWQIPRIKHETYTYSVIEEYREPGDLVIAPAFFGHVTENGRVIGILLEKLEGSFASMDDLPACREAMENFHLMNMVHGDVNHYNFIIDRSRNLLMMGSPILNTRNHMGNQRRVKSSNNCCYSWRKLL